MTSHLAQYCHFDGMTLYGQIGWSCQVLCLKNYRQVLHRSVVCQDRIVKKENDRSRYVILEVPTICILS